MKPGYYPDMSNQKYHSVSGTSKSALALLKKSPAHYAERYIYGEPQEHKAVFDIGTAFHTRTLEPEKYKEQVFCGPTEYKKSKAEKIAWGEFESIRPGKIILRPSEYKMIEEMAASAYAHPEARKYLEAEGGVEESFFAKDPITGQLCKCRPDKRIPSMAKLMDMKSTDDASPSAFSKACLNFTYYLQDPFYRDVVAEATGELYEQFVFIAVEKKPPYLVGVYHLNAEDVKLGRREYVKLLRLLKECRETNTWGGYSDRLVEINLPGFGVKKLEDELND